VTGLAIAVLVMVVATIVLAHEAAAHEVERASDSG